jgi:hypothetical protein
MHGAGEVTMRKHTVSRSGLVRVVLASVVTLAAGVVPVLAGTTPSPQPAQSQPTGTTAPHTKLKPVTGVKAPQTQSRTAKAAATPKVGVSAFLPDSTCVPPVAGVRSCDLTALAGSIVVPGIVSPVPIWGFSPTPAGPATLPGPTLVMLEGETLSIMLHNHLPAAGGNLSLEIPQSTATPDLTGIAVGSSNALNPYTFTGLAAGTYVYEAGATANGQRQVAMGLTGMLVVRPKTWSATSHTAYDDTGSTFTAESPLQLNDIDTSFNADPANGDLRHFSPNVFLINGQAFNKTVPLLGSITVSAGDRLLLRYADLGLRERSMTISNARQTEWASDANVLKVQPELASVYLNPVQTADTLTLIDPSAPLGTLIPLYDQGHHFTTPGGGLGGMITMLNVAVGLAGIPAGPTATVNVSPKTNDGTSDVTVTGTITSQLPVGVISGAEWFFDQPGAPGTGAPISVSLVSPSPTTYGFTIPAATWKALANASPPVNGQHIIWVHGKDVFGWGVTAGDVFDVNVSGPMVSDVSVHSTPTNGSRVNDIDGTTDIDIIGSATVSLPDYVIKQAELCVDSPCVDGQGTALNLVSTANIITPGANDPAAAVVGLSGALPFATLQQMLGAAKLAGPHTFYIHACEAPASSTATTCTRWGDVAGTFATATFVVDQVGPATKALAALPDPNNGFQSDSGNVAYLNEERVNTTFDDSTTGNSPIRIAEVFISAPNAAAPTVASYGTGAEMVPAGGAWGVSAVQSASAFIPLPDVAAFPEGYVWFWAHGQDLAGNWGPFQHYAMKLDKTPPVIDSATVTPTPPTTATSVSLHLTAHDPVSGGVNSNIVQAEYFITPCTPGTETSCFQDPGPGNATQIPVPGNSTSIDVTVSIPTPPHGSRLLVRVKDAAGNWTAVDFNKPVATF